MFNIMLKNKNCGENIMLFIYKSASSKQFKKDYFIRMYLWMIAKYSIILDHTMTSIRIYQSFITIFHKWMNIAISILDMSPIMLALCILNAFNDPICSKLCWQNKRFPKWYVHNFSCNSITLCKIAFMQLAMFCRGANYIIMKWNTIMYVE